MPVQECSFGTQLLLSFIQAVVFGIVINIAMIVIFRTASRYFNWREEQKIKKQQDKNWETARKIASDHDGRSN